MTTPKIVKASVLIKYTASDKFRYSYDARSREAQPMSQAVEGSKVLLKSFAELARLLELFGMGAEAEAKFKESTEAVKKWRALLDVKEST